MKKQYIFSLIGYFLLLISCSSQDNTEQDSDYYIVTNPPLLSDTEINDNPYTHDYESFDYEPFGYEPFDYEPFGYEPFGYEPFNYEPFEQIPFTIPLNIRSSVSQNDMENDFISEFDNIHRVTQFRPYHFWWYDEIFLWTDTYLSDFSIVEISVLDEAGGMRIFTERIIFEIDELLSTDVIIFNVALFHYLRPEIAIIFTDETGLENRIFIWLSMKDGDYHLGQGLIYSWHYFSQSEYLENYFNIEEPTEEDIYVIDESDNYTSNEDDYIFDIYESFPYEYLPYDSWV